MWDYYVATEPQMLSSELQLSYTTAIFFHLEQFVIHGIASQLPNTQNAPYQCSQKI